MTDTAGSEVAMAEVPLPHTYTDDTGRVWGPHRGYWCWKTATSLRKKEDRVRELEDQLENVRQKVWDFVYGECRGSVTAEALSAFWQRTFPNDDLALSADTGCWEPVVPEPFYWGLFPWVWKRLTGYRDAYGRKAQLLKPWEV